MANPTPVRIQRKRTKGYNMQTESVAINGLPAKSCARPGRWGNPYPVGKSVLISANLRELSGKDPVWWRNRRDGLQTFWLTLDESLECFEGYVNHVNWEPLRGYNLACFCTPDSACHVDVILRRLYGDGN